jgi:hypothetical protein
MSTSIFEYRKNCFLGVSKRFFPAIALGYDLRKGRDEHHEAAPFLRLEND